MTVATERVFRSDETPQLKLVTRNIESVTVRAYKVDLETYFRKMHLAPRRRRARHRPDRSRQDVRVQGAEIRQVPAVGERRRGAASRRRPLRRDGRHRQQQDARGHHAADPIDLDVIVKSSRDEVFVFAENMLTGKPWAGVKLLVSNGREVFAEAETGPDGVLQKSYPELKDAGDVRVFAVGGGQVASNVVDLQGVGVARGLTDRGYVYSDRPAYRAGQPVNLRGCLRHAANDAYAVENGKKFTVEVFDSRNRLVGRQQVTLDDFGSFHANFLLPATSPQGQYRVLVHDDVGQNYQGTFQVHEYRLDPVRLVVDTPRRVYYRGEQIEGTIRADVLLRRTAGRPRNPLSTGRRAAQYTAATDAERRGPFQARHPRLQRDAKCSRWPSSCRSGTCKPAANFVLASRGFSVAMSTIRPVYVAGETFETTVKTIDAEGKPTAQKLKLKVLEQTVVAGKVGERLVREDDVATAADGAARQTVKLEKGGRYILRAEGTDRFHNPDQRRVPGPGLRRRGRRAAAHPGRPRTRSRSATRPRCNSTGARSRHWRWSRSRAPECWTTSWCPCRKGPIRWRFPWRPGWRRTSSWPWP